MFRTGESSLRPLYRLPRPLSSAFAALKSASSVLLRRKRSESAAPRRPRRRIRKLRLLALVGVLGVLSLTAFSYGVVVAVGQQLNGLDPFKQAQRQQVD